MNAIVIEHVPLAELPPAWRAKLADSSNTHVTVRIESEAPNISSSDDEFVTDDPAFGIWRDRADISDTADYLGKLRAPRYNRDGSRKAS